jgi:hypothetical protein
VLLQEEDDEHVEGCEADAPDDGRPEEQVEGDGSADDRRGRRPRWRSRKSSQST